MNAVSTPSIFSTGTAASASPWKTVSKATSGTADTVFHAKPTTGDSVSISKLGQALKGVAGDIFGLMDKKSKQMVEQIVASGAMSAEDVAQGLRAAASKNLFTRYTIERPKDAEDKAMQEAADKSQAALERFSKEAGAAMHEVGKANIDAMAALGRGEVDTAGFQKMMEEPDRVFKEKMELIEKEKIENGYDDTGKYITMGYKKNFDMFNDVVNKMGGEDGFFKMGQELYDSKAEEKTMKLLQLVNNMSGLSIGTINDVEKTITSYTNSVDIPGVGRNGPSLDELKAAQGDDAAGPAAAAAATSAPPAATPTPPAVAAAPSATATAKAAADPGKAKTAISLLQSALDAKTKAKASPVTAVTAASAAADAGLSSLIDALKSGAKPASPNVKIDT
jgi:hypothetical protein